MKLFRKTKLSFFLFIVLLSISCSGIKTDNDLIEETTFLVHIGDTGLSRGVTVEQTNDGGYILTGYVSAEESKGEDVVLIKTDKKGEVLWKKTFGGAGADNGWAVRQIADEGYIIVGFTNSFGSGDMDIYLIRTDSKGEPVWSKTFGGENDEYGWDVRITNDNEFIIAAQTNSFGEGEADAYLLKVDKDGNERWSNTFGGANTDRVFSVQQTPDGGYVAAGITYSYSSIGPNDRDGYLLKADASGHQEWYKVFGEDLYDVAHSVALTNDMGYIITGYGDSFSTPGNRDVYLIKTDPNGENSWIEVFGEAGEERGIKGLQTKDGGYAVIGFTDRNNNLYFAKTNGSGDVLWERTYGTPERVDFGYTVKETNDGGYILIGHSASSDGENSSILLIKTDNDGLVAAID